MVRPLVAAHDLFEDLRGSVVALPQTTAVVFATNIDKDLLNCGTSDSWQTGLILT